MKTMAREAKRKRDHLLNLDVRSIKRRKVLKNR
jgi:hypothetical protein